MNVATLLAWLTLSQLSPSIFADGFDPPLPIGCPSSFIATDGVKRSRLLTSAVGYGAMQVTRPAVDLLEWDRVYGYNNATPGPPHAWPGVTGSAPTVKAFRMDSYVALHFKAPANPEAGLAGSFSIPTGVGSPPVTLAISRACADFAHYLPAPGCVVTSPQGDAPVLYWHFGAVGACALPPGTDLYFNWMYPNTTDRTRCTSASPTCRIAVWR